MLRVMTWSPRRRRRGRRHRGRERELRGFAAVSRSRDAQAQDARRSEEAVRCQWTHTDEATGKKYLCSNERFVHPWRRVVDPIACPSSRSSAVARRSRRLTSVPSLDATRIMLWVVSLSSLRPFGPNRDAPRRWHMSYWRWRPRHPASIYRGAQRFSSLYGVAT